MTIKAQLADGTVLEFEDGTPDNVIDSVVQQQMSGGSSPPDAAASAGGKFAPLEAKPDTGAFEKELGAYYAGLKGKPIDTSVIGSLATKYNIGTPTNLPEIEEFYKRSGRLNPQVNMLGPEAPPTPAEDPNKIVTTVPKAGEWGQRARAFGKGLLFDFNDELEAAGRMLVSGELSPDEYYRIKDQINADYKAWAKANPYESLGWEAAGGLTGAFVPGLGQIGTGARALRGAKGLEATGSVVAQGLKSGAITGGLSGVGQADTMSPSDLAYSTALGTVTGGAAGATFGKATELAGRGFAAGRNAVMRRLGQETGVTPVENRVAEVLYGSTPSPTRAAGATALSEKYGVPTAYGLSTPELSALTEKVLAKPSGGRKALTTQLTETQAQAQPRVEALVEGGFPGAKDYFDVEDTITQNLRNIGENEYQKAFQVGVVNDPQLIAIANNPELSSIWAKAQRLARLEGRDLPIKMEPVLDASGALVGLKPTKDVIPDVQSLHYLKRALDDTIDAGFRGSAGVGKAEAAALKESIRKPLLSRLDQLVPEYAEARAKYAGDLEVRDALRLGRDLLKRTIRPQQLERSLQGMSDAEREALKTGARQSIFEPLEDATTNRNFAQRLRGVRGDSATLQKLRMVMDPAEFRFFDRALKLEDDLFKRGSRVMGGSRATPLAQGVAMLDDMIAKNDIPAAVNFVMSGNPGRIASLARWASNLQPGKEFGDKVYTRLSQVLSAKNPEQLREVLDLLRRSKSYGQYMARVKDIAAGPVAGIAGNVAPSAFEDKSSASPPMVIVGGAENTPGDVVERARRAVDQPAPETDQGGQAPQTIEEEPSAGLSAMPGSPSASAGPGGPATGGTNVFDAIAQIMPDFRQAFDDGSIVDAAGAVMEGSDVAKALGVPLQTWLSYVRGQ